MMWNAILMIVLAAACLLSGRTLVHYFQLESYQFPGYFRTVHRNLLRAVLPGALLNVVWLILFFGMRLLGSERERVWIVCLSAALLLIGTAFLIRRGFASHQEKKPFVLTARVKRLYGTGLVLFSAVLLLLSYMNRTAVFDPSGLTTSPAALLILLFPSALPIWIALTGLAAWPLEKLISECYFRDAQKILKKRNDLIRIGITGSWGKTSVKFILGTILEEKYHTLVTPASFNTPMGVTKVIRSRLDPGHRVFVAEMGARHVGDIREMCRLVHPTIGILTSVGPQHLDTFKTIERVEKTKYELMEAVPSNGACFFADDGGICRKLYDRTEKNKFLAGLDPERNSVWAEEISVSERGSSFMLCTSEGKIACSTVLLGELNIRNIVLAAAVGLYLGMSLQQIARGIGKLKPVEHRLQLIAHPGRFSVIDDAFNSNIIGAKQAFNVLRQFTGRRIVVTPGMVELGGMEGEMNLEFGEALSDCCDFAILVGEKRSRPIAEGLRRKGFPEERVIVAQDLHEAENWLKEHAAAGDTVLFENDLPDNYSE